MKTPRDWVTRPLSQFVSLQRGFDLPTHARVPGSVPVLSSGGVNGSHNEAKVDGDNFVIGRVTNIGRPTWSSVPFWPLSTTLFVKDFLGNFPKFCFYWFLATDLSGFDSGSVQPTLNRNYIANIPVAIPSFVEQRRIAEVLGALDDKIESNRRIAVKCDEIANILFHQAASVNRKLDEVSEVRMGVSPPGSSYNETGDGMAFFQGVRDFSLLHPVARVYTNQPKRLAAAGDILFSVRAPVGRLNIADSPCCIGRGLAAITSNRSATCLFALRAAAAEWEKFSAEGTVFGAVNQKSLKSTLIPWPDPVAEEELEHQLSSLVTLVSQSERESISLSKLRDALLPELMSGRMRVDEAGQLVSEALDEEVR